MATDQSCHPHAVLVPGPGFGHVNCCLLLAKSLLSAGFSVTVACFARSYSTHASKGRIKIPNPSIRLEIVPDGLPPEAASYEDLFCFGPGMHQGLVQLLERLASQQQAATCLISDSIMAWTQDVADHVGIPRVDFWTATATAYLTIVALPDLVSKGIAGSHKGPTPLSWRSKEPISLDCIPGLPGFPLDEVPAGFRYADSIEDPVMHMFLQTAKHAKHADCVLIHSVYDLEIEGFQALEQSAGIQAYAIGPLLQQDDDPTAKKCVNDTSLTWLDSQAKSSVMYVSFGSNVELTEDEVVELALGLEESGHAFLWVIRSDGIEKGRKLDDVLPPGFQSRIAGKGLILPWVSQQAVLAHPAVGGFLSHCGWNSTLESLWTGVPILAWPRKAEQPINSRLIVKDWGVGIELETTEEGTFSRGEVEKGVRALLEGSAGHVACSKAREFSHLVRNVPCEGGQSHSNLLRFASKMKERSLQVH